KLITYGLSGLGIALGSLGNSWSIWGGILLGTGAYLGTKLSLLTKLQKKTLFEQNVASLQPTRTNHPIFKTKRETFNQIFSFILDHENNIWYALRDPHVTPNWKPIYIEDFPPPDVKEVELKSDGENLIAKATLYASKENKSTLFYKKVYQEHRDDDVYSIYNVADSPYSINQWFTLPLVSWLTPQYWNKRLTIQSQSRWAVSHSGKLRLHIQDKKLQWHAIWGVTTIIEQRHQDLILYDPYWPPGFEIKISLPPEFMLIDLATTSSKVFLLGRSYKGEWMLCTSSLDYDILGLNPFMHYTLDASQKNARLLPLTNWETTKISLQNLTGKINAIQFGVDKNTQMQLEWCDTTTRGFYFKNLIEDAWYSHKLCDLEKEDWYTLDSLPQQPLILKNTVFFGKKFSELAIAHFDEHCLNAKITLKNAQEIIIFNLQRTSNIVNDFLTGKPNYYWILSLAPDFQTEENRKWLKNSLNFPVQIEHTLNYTLINCPDKFSLRFEPVKGKMLCFSDRSLKNSENQDEKLEAFFKQKVSL
ncbi:MAG TPA: hypothetical protein VFP93_00365, partial [Gammaproteobacteria bacterium]|nr:hypothetical protein [Gammaproteobacteria bacterium]